MRFVRIKTKEHTLRVQKRVRDKTGIDPGTLGATAPLSAPLYNGGGRFRNIRDNIVTEQQYAEHNFKNKWQNREMPSPTHHAQPTHSVHSTARAHTIHDAPQSIVLQMLEIWAIYTEFLPSSQTIPALLTASNACSKEKKTFYSVSWIKRQ